MSDATVAVAAEAGSRQLAPASSGRLQLLDVLRGLSIAIVLASHALSYQARPTVSPWLAPFIRGGMGVGIFFVISGFIITRLLLDERRDTGRIDLYNFYFRRASKLCPALFLYCAVAAISSSFIPWSCPAWPYVTSALFLTEIFPVDCWPVQHTWSLSVEELFYVTWAPLIARYASRVAVKVAIFAIVLAPVVRLMNHAHFSAIFGFALPFDIPFFAHADHLAIGSLVAMAVDRRWSAPGVVRLLAKPIVAFGVIYASAVWYHNIPGLKFLRFGTVPLSATVQAVVIGCVLWHHAADAAALRPSRNWFMRAAAGLGLISYSLYVWQQFFLTQERVVVHWVQHFPGNLVVALAAGTASYLFLEEPCRKALRGWFLSRRAARAAQG